jgi:hypothetical protein
VALLLQLVPLGAFAAEPLFYIRDLHPFATRAFNDRGEFTGSFPGTGAGVWSRTGGFTPLLPPEGFPPGWADAVGINNAGQVVGSWSTDVSPFPTPLFWNSAAARAVSIPLPWNGGPSALNSTGVVVGTAGNPSGTAAWIWRGDAVERLPWLADGPPGSQASDINDTGTAVGSSGGFDQPIRAVRWRDGAVESLGTLPDRNVSRAWTASSGMTSLGPGAAHAISDSGWVIGPGLESLAGGPAFLWRPDAGRKDLASHVDLSGTGFTDLGYVTDINAFGQILGVARLPDGSYHSYLLTPVPEPETWLFAALGAAFLLVRLRRRTR